MSHNSSTTSGQGSNRGNMPAQKCFGSKVFTESDSSSDESDYPGQEHQGGAKLNQSPYRPPQISVPAPAVQDSPKGKGKAVAAPSISDDGIDTPDSTDSGSPLAVRLDKLHFQRGPLAGDGLFESSSSSSAVKDEDNDESLSEGDFEALVAEANRRARMTRARQELVAGLGDTAPMHQPTPGRHLVGNMDAQKVYPPTACVFVANLLQDKSDQALEAEVTRHFASFGTVYVKMKRDHRDMPFAFLQYTNDEDAVMAIQNGNQVRVFNRPCRVEQAKANRTFIVHRNDHRDISVAEVTAMVARDGVVSVIEPLRPDLAEIMGLRNVIYVEFVHFDCDRDLVLRYRGDREYRVAAFDINKVFRNQNRDAPDQEFLSEYTRGRKTVWVGNLTRGITDHHLRNVFQTVGEVVDLRLVRRFQNNTASFALIEFERPEMCQAAIDAFNGLNMHGTNIVVQMKINRQAAPRRLNSSYVREVAGHRDAPERNNRGPTPRRNFTATPGSTPYHNAQAVMDPASMRGKAGARIPEIHVTPHPAHVGSLAADYSVSPMVVSSQHGTPAGNPAATMAPNVELAAQASSLSALAPPFGPAGFYVPSPGPIPPFGAYQPNVFGGFGGYGGHPVQGFYAGTTFYQDPASGLIHQLPANMPPHLTPYNPAFAQRSFSAATLGPAAQQQFVPNQTEAVKPKKSVTFANTPNESSSNQDGNGETEAENGGAA